MEGYTASKGLHNSVIFRKNGKTVKGITVPAHVAEHLRNQIFNGVSAKAGVKQCIFCGEPSTRRRFVNVQTIALCDEDYFNKSIGECVQQLRGDSNEDETTGQGNSEGTGTEINNGQLQENPSS